MLTDELIVDLWSPGSSRPVLGKNKVVNFARSIEAEVRKEQASKIAELERQLEAARKDSERYQFLRRCRGQEHDPLFTVQHEIDGTLWGGDLDYALDAARKDQP